jgi:hypothetical protein
MESRATSELSRNPPEKGSFGAGRRLGRCLSARIEFEDSRDHDDRLRSVAILEQGELERFGAIDKQAAAHVPLILDHPVAAAVAAKQEY